MTRTPPWHGEAMRRRVPYATIIVVAVILTAVLLPGSSLPRGPAFPGFDKLVHGGMFLALALAAGLDFRLAGAGRLLAALAAASIFAALTEVSQLFVPGRSCDGYDLLGDVLGFAVGLMLHRIAKARAARLS